MDPRPTILLKLTGTLLRSEHDAPTTEQLIRIGSQIQTLASTHQFAIVIGGGNIFRGSTQGKQLGLSAPHAHQIGMLATVMNGIIIQDTFERMGISTALFCAFACPQVGPLITMAGIEAAKAENRVMIFAGGSGNPFISTDTTAIIRALQINASEVWKGTDVDGVYTDNPRTNPAAQHISRISYKEIIAQQLQVMDMAAYCLALEHDLPIRIFNIFTPQALIQCATTQNIGTIIYKE